MGSMGAKLHSSVFVWRERACLERGGTVVMSRREGDFVSWSELPGWSELPRRPAFVRHLSLFSRACLVLCSDLAGIHVLFCSSYDYTRDNNFLQLPVLFIILGYLDGS